MTADQFAYRMHRLRARFRLHEHDAEELTQEMLLAVFNAKLKYRNGKVAVSAYLKAVLNRSYCDICRRLGRECRRRSRTRHLGDRADIVCAVDPQLATDWLSPQYAQLGESTADLVFDLARMTPTQVARVRGVDRGTVHRQMARLRERFGEAN
ncbi:MAG: sigma factor [Phycisphaerales bacterium]